MSSETELLSVSTASKTKTMETSSTADNGQAESSGNNNENSSDIHLNKRLAEDDGPKPPTKKAKASIGPDFKTMPTRQYLDSTVVPILLEALASLAKDRPNDDPIDYLITYLQRHKKPRSTSGEENSTKDNLPPM